VNLAIEADEGELVLLIARRDGERFAIVAPVGDARLVDRAIRSAA
jgi:hypothetical protein